MPAVVGINKTDKEVNDKDNADPELERHVVVIGQEIDLGEGLDRDIDNQHHREDKHNQISDRQQSTVRVRQYT
jgi:hypothetical protein